MKTRSMLFGSLLVALLATPAVAQVGVVVTPPTLAFVVQPPLVVVSPGIMVVEDYPEEVFFVSGWYWHRHGGHWFKARDYRGGWVMAPGKVVPASLMKFTPGKYKHFKVKQAKYSDNGGGNGGWSKASAGGGGKHKGGGEGKHKGGGGKHKGK